MNIFEEISPYFLTSSGELLLTIVGVAFGGAIGAYARYCITVFFVKRNIVYIPFGTLCANWVGSFFIGLGTSFFILSRTSIPSALGYFLFIGVLGALTTFSTFAYDCFMLWANEERLKAIIVVFANIFGGLFLGFAGFLLPLL